MIPFNWYQISGTGRIWYHSIGSTYMKLVKTDSIQLVSYIWNWLKLMPFNWYQISGIGRIWYCSIGIAYMKLMKTDTVQLVSDNWTWLDWYHSIGIRYSVFHDFIPPRFFSGNQGNHQNFEKSLLPHKLWLIWIRISKKKYFFLKEKILNCQLKKTDFFNYPQKLSNCRQNLHYRADRLSNVSPNYGFFVFLALFGAYIGRRLTAI